MWPWTSHYSPVNLRPIVTGKKQPLNLSNIPIFTMHGQSSCHTRECVNHLLHTIFFGTCNLYYTPPLDFHREGNSILHTCIHCTTYKCLECSYVAVPQQRQLHPLLKLKHFVLLTLKGGYHVFSCYING